MDKPPESKPAGKKKEETKADIPGTLPWIVAYLLFFFWFLCDLWPTRSDLTPCWPLPAINHNKVNLLVYSWHVVCILLPWATSLGKRCDPLLSQHMLNVIRHNGHALKALPYHTSLTTTPDLTLSTSCTMMLCETWQLTVHHHHHLVTTATPLPTWGAHPLYN